MMDNYSSSLGFDSGEGGASRRCKLALSRRHLRALPTHLLTSLGPPASSVPDVLRASYAETPAIAPVLVPRSLYLFIIDGLLHQQPAWWNAVLLQDYEDFCNTFRYGMSPPGRGVFETSTLLKCTPPCFDRRRGLLVALGQDKHVEKYCAVLR